MARNNNDNQAYPVLVGVDKLGQEIHIGDLIAVAVVSGYIGSIRLGQVESMTRLDRPWNRHVLVDGEWRLEPCTIIEYSFKCKELDEDIQASQRFNNSKTFKNKENVIRINRDSITVPLYHKGNREV